MSLESDEKSKKDEQLIPKVSQPKVQQDKTSSSYVMAEVRCPHVLENKHTKKKFRCNYKAMELEFGRGTTKCRNCRQIFSFEVNTTHVKFDDGSYSNGQTPEDILE